MKEIITKETVQVVQETHVFEADDGKHFDTLDACRKYELQKNRDKVVREFERLNVKRLSAKLIEYFDSEATMYRLCIKTHQEYLTLLDYFDAFNYYHKELKEEQFVNNDIIVYFCCDYINIYSSTEAFKAELNKFIEELN